MGVWGWSRPTDEAKAGRNTHTQEDDMRAFIETEVSKEDLLASLAANREADRLIQGEYWNDGKGCAVGCTLHDYRPGEEADHTLYEPLFGWSQRLARLEDRIFEGLPAKQAIGWPERLTRAVAVGCDTDRAVDHWMLWLLSNEGSPLAQWQEEAPVFNAANLYRRRLDGDEPDQGEWDAARDAARAAAEAAARAAAGDAARDAARAAAGDAAWAAAWAAAGAAAGDAAGDAVRDAVRAAAGAAARDAAGAAAWAAAGAAAGDAARAAAWYSMADALCEAVGQD